MMITGVYGTEWNESDVSSFGIFDDVPSLDKKVCDGF